MALTKGNVVVKEVNDENAQDTKLRELMGRITMVVSPELAKHGFLPSHAPHGCHITITMKDGSVFNFEQNRGPWEPATTPSFDTLAEKFSSCAELVIDKHHIDEAIDFCRNLENQDNIIDLMDIVRN